MVVAGVEVAAPGSQEPLREITRSRSTVSSARLHGARKSPDSAISRKNRDDYFAAPLRASASAPRTGSITPGLIAASGYSERRRL